MKLIETITSSSLFGGFQRVNCTRPNCGRWLTQRHFETRKVGVTFGGEWYCSYRCVATELERTLGKMMGRTSPSSKHSFRMPLGLTLVSRGYLTEEQLKTANEKQKTDGQEFSDVLLSLKYIDEKKLTSVRAAQWGCAVFSVPDYVESPAISLPRELMKRYFMVPLQYAKNSKRISIGFANKLEYGALYAVEQMTGCKATPFLITAKDFERCLELPAPESSSEQLFETRPAPAEIRHTICTAGAEMDAEEVSVVRCGDYLWARLQRETKCTDLLFELL